MVTTQSATKISARSRLIESIAWLCILAGFPVWATARLAASLVLPPRSRRSRVASNERGSSARCDGASQAHADRTQVRLLLAPTSPTSLPYAAEVEAGVVCLPDAAWPITPHEQKHGTASSHQGANTRFRHNSFPSPRRRRGVASGFPAGRST